MALHYERITCFSKYTEQHVFTVLVLERLFFHEKISVLEEIDFFTKIAIGKMISLCVRHALCVGSLVFFFQIAPCVCGPCTVVCEKFEIFKVPLCVGPMLYCVRTLRFS